MYIKYFKLPLDEATLNNILNNPGVLVTAKHIFPNKDGGVTICLEYNDYSYSTEVGTYVESNMEGDALNEI